jgi:hypothetical protein
MRADKRGRKPERADKARRAVLTSGGSRPERADRWFAALFYVRFVRKLRKMLI